MAKPDVFNYERHTDMEADLIIANAEVRALKMEVKMARIEAETYKEALREAYRRIAELEVRG